MENDDSLLIKVKVKWRGMLVERFRVKLHFYRYLVCFRDKGMFSQFTT